MSAHFEDVPCPCPWCRLAGQQNSLHRVRRMLFDDKPLSQEAKAILDEIVKDALRQVQTECSCGGMNEGGNP